MDAYKNTCKRSRWGIPCAFLALCLAMLICKGPKAQAADSSSDTWDHYAAADFSGGSGSQEDPWQIATPQELAKLAADINSGTLDKNHSGKYFKLMNSLDLSAYRWIPIGQGSAMQGVSHHSFRGYFDGNGCEITGMYVDEGRQDYSAGLFGNMGSGGIKNLYISNAVVKTWYSDPENLGGAAGILVGYISGDRSSYVTVSGCHVSGSVRSAAYTGGLAGSSCYIAFSDCSADATVSGHMAAGGFVGDAADCSIQSCTARGEVVSSGWSNGGFAGVLWTFYAPMEVSHCLTSCDVSAKNWNTGGFVGYLSDARVTITGCVALGDVVSTAQGFQPRAGGFAGSNMGSNIQNCHAAGTVTADSGTFPPGGFLGYEEGGSVSGCSFDQDKNAGLGASGEVGAAGSTQIAGATTVQNLGNICVDYYGGHSYSQEWTVDQEASCTQAGSKSRHCGRCGGKTDMTEIPALGHSWGTEWEKDSTGHWHGCGNEGCPVTENSQKDGYGKHVFANGDSGDCSVCGYHRALTPSEVTTKINQKDLTEVPEGLKGTSFHTVEKIQEELQRVLLAGGGYISENTAFYDVSLLVSTDGGATWKEAGEDNFPADGITVLLPYPAGTGRDTHEFAVTHMFTITSQRLGTVAGNVEKPQVSKLEEGIQVTLMGLSPVGIAWKAADQQGGGSQEQPGTEQRPADEDKPSENGGQDNDKKPSENESQGNDKNPSENGSQGNDKNPSENGSQGNDKNPSQGGEQADSGRPSGSGSQVNDNQTSGGGNQTEAGSSREDSPKTGEEGNGWLWAVILASGVGLLAVRRGMER